MRNKAPAFQFYPGDFLSDENIALMDNQEVGCYIKLICFCWLQKSIPREVDKIAKLCGESENEMNTMWESIRPCFKVKKDRLVHPRLERERKKQKKYSENRKKAGKKGSDKRWKNNKLDSKATVKPMAKNSSLTSSSSSTSSLVKEQRTELISLCRKILQLPRKTNRGFDPRDYVKISLDRKQHPLAIIEALKQLIKLWDTIGLPDKYADSILLTKSQNYNEKEHTEESQQFKEIWASEDVSQLIQGVGVTQ